MKEARHLYEALCGLVDWADKHPNGKALQDAVDTAKHAMARAEADHPEWLKDNFGRARSPVVHVRMGELEQAIARINKTAERLEQVGKLADRSQRIARMIRTWNVTRYDFAAPRPLMELVNELADAIEAFE